MAKQDLTPDLIRILLRPRTLKALGIDNRSRPMKTFLSWSGSKSHAVASLFSEWAPCVVQAVQPWISSRDIDRGAIWFTEITEQLKDTNFGVLFVTRENQVRPWLLFEAGALSKGLTEARVCTVLIDLNVRDIESGSPLQQVNHTTLDKEGILSLLKTINKRMDTGQVQEKRLEQTFNALWPEFESKFQAILQIAPTDATPERDDKDVLNDILENVLSIKRRVTAGGAHRQDPHISRLHAERLVKQLVKMDLDRGDVQEAVEGLIPNRWLGDHLDVYFGKEQEEDPDFDGSGKGGQVDFPPQ